MVRANFWAPAPLELCGVEVVGAAELQLAGALLAAQRHTAAVSVLGPWEAHYYLGGP